MSLAEIGTHVLFGTQMAGCTTSEIALSRTVLPHLEGACYVWRIPFFRIPAVDAGDGDGRGSAVASEKNMRLACEKQACRMVLAGNILLPGRDWRHGANGVAVRVIEYRLDGVADAEPVHRLVTTTPGSRTEAPASELAALYHERWEIETAFDELKTHLRGARIVLRSKTPDLVHSGEFYSLLMAHFACTQPHARRSPQGR